MVAWWILWIVEGLLGNGIMRATLHSNTVAELHALTVLNVVSDVLSVPLLLLARHIVQRVSRDQSDNHGG